jgi:signal transduction histidine kinase
VASILGYTDTILDNPDIAAETKHQFIRRTNAQARRLTALLQDISTLNRMDYAPDMLAMERIDISRIMADIAEETALVVGTKQMRLNNCLPEDVCVQGNWSLVYSIFRNLMDNAINYAGNGASIEISAEDQGSHWAFTFRDNGVGVPAEHLHRIFERFYRVDKGRSRQMGGTGLGLAIVKNAILLHGGQISAKKADGGGLQFDFTLRKQYVCPTCQ